MGRRKGFAVLPMRETPTSGKGTLDTWRSDRQRGGRTQSPELVNDFETPGGVN
jgi:hypothetical protein